MTPVWERRSGQRIAVRLHVVETHEDATYLQRTANISVGGLFLEGTMPHPPGTRVRLQFALPNDPQPITVEGEILPVKDGEVGMGVRFVGLSDDDRQRIERFVDDTIGLPIRR